MKKLVLGAIAAVLVPFATVHSADLAAGKAKAEGVCIACHGADGNSPLAINPKLAGQNAAYLVKQLQEFKSGERQNPVMMGMAAALTDEDMLNVSAFYASQKSNGGAAAADKVALGERIYRGGIADKGVAACTACHGPTGSGISTSGFPAVSGQHADYIEVQLNNFAEGKRANDANRMMRDIAAKLSKDEIAAVAQYMQGLK